MKKYLFIAISVSLLLSGVANSASQQSQASAEKTNLLPNASFGTHTSFACELIEVFDLVFRSEQFPCLFIGNHLKSLNFKLDK